MKRLFSIFILSCLFVLPVQASYSDVPSSHPYVQGIHYIELQGAADSADTFNPDEVITRAEGFKLLFEVLQIEASETDSAPFEDTPLDAWFTPYAKLALDHELISDRMPNFSPDKQIRRLDALRLMMQVYGLSTPIIPEDSTAIAADVDVNSPAYPWLYQLERLDIIDANEEDYFAPYSPITRGEFAQWLFEFDAWLQNFELDEIAIQHADFYKSDILESIWYQIVNDAYLEENTYIDHDALFQAAVKGMVESLNDPYSQYFTPEEANSFTESISGEFEGIGAILGTNESGQSVVQGVLEGSPAAEVGLKKNDIIIAVDGVDVIEMNLKDVISRIKGPVGTDVTLSILRNGETLHFKITRAHIEIITISGNIKWGDVWFIDIDSFSTDLPGKLMEVIFELEEQVSEPSAIVLDLRGNPGGSLQAAAFTIGLFVPQLTPSLQLDYGSYTEIIYNGDTGPYQDHPLTILMDENSASASEIVALTMQENGATIIGQQSFGKGTAQHYVTYWDGSALKLTIAEWLSGQGQSIQGVGVSPNIVVDVEADESEWLQILERAL